MQQCRFIYIHLYKPSLFLGIRGRWAFKTNIVIHNPLQGRSVAGGHCLCQENGIIPIHKLAKWYYYVVQPIESMNSMSSNCVVMTNYSSWEQGGTCFWIVYSNLSESNQTKSIGYKSTCIYGVEMCPKNTFGKSFRCNNYFMLLAYIIWFSHLMWSTIMRR